MPKLPKQNDNAPLQRPKAAARLTGLSESYIRAGLRDGTIAHVRCGRDYLVNMPLLLKQLGVEG